MDSLNPRYRPQNVDFGRVRTNVVIIGAIIGEFPGQVHWYELFNIGHVFSVLESENLEKLGLRKYKTVHPDWPLAQYNHGDMPTPALS